VTRVANADASCLLFVYGSLKRGQANHHELAGARFIATARTAPNFALRELAGYPALVPGERAIEGELFQISQSRLRALDEFEGDAYERRQIPIEDGSLVIAYLARRPEAGSPSALDSWPAPTTER
jgi:gamma-glutamylcyclotransferase (GGCT)/AIG2-like uncharacterized protein YtfP